MSLPEKDVLRASLSILNSVFQEWVKVERAKSGLFKNRGGHYVRIGKKNEPDIGGYVLKGRYIAKPLAIEVKKSDFNPAKIYAADKQRFQDQCDWLRSVNESGGIGIWVNDVRTLYPVLISTLVYGSRVTLDQNNRVIVTRIKTL